MANDIRLNEMTSLSVERIVDILSNSYSKLINDGKKVSLFPSVMLWGQPGVGKSQGVKEIASRIGKLTGKRVDVTDVRLLLFNPIDLRGIPVANEDRTLAVWLKPKIFQMDDSNDVVNILFLDEISAAPQSVQSAAYQITLDRVVGEHKLPDNCIVIAAGNRVTDKSVSYKMPKALANRLLHFDTETSFDSWKRWAIRSGIHPLVTGFLNFRPDLLNTFDPGNDSLSFATPRSWEMVSNILNNISTDFDTIQPLITGLVGRGIATELKSWSKVYSNLPNVEMIFEGTERKVPSNQSELFALTCSIINYAKTHFNNVQGIVNSINYAKSFPKDYSVLMIEEYLRVDKEAGIGLLEIPEFHRYLNDVTSRLNGVKNGLF